VVSLTDTRGNPNYPVLAAVIKMSLSLLHEQGGAEMIQFEASS